MPITASLQIQLIILHRHLRQSRKLVWFYIGLQKQRVCSHMMTLSVYIQNPSSNMFTLPIFPPYTNQKQADFLILELSLCDGWCLCLCITKHSACHLSMFTLDEYLSRIRNACGQT